jgi:hypothetical protein
VPTQTDAGTRARTTMTHGASGLRPKWPSRPSGHGGPARGLRAAAARRRPGGGLPTGGPGAAATDRCSCRGGTSPLSRSRSLMVTVAAVAQASKSESAAFNLKFPGLRPGLSLAGYRGPGRHGDRGRRSR